MIKAIILEEQYVPYEALGRTYEIAICKYLLLGAIFNSKKNY